MAARSNFSRGMSSQEADSEVTHGDGGNERRLELMAKSGWKGGEGGACGIMSTAEEKCECVYE